MRVKATNLHPMPLPRATPQRPPRCLELGDDVLLSGQEVAVARVESDSINQQDNQSHTHTSDSASGPLLTSVLDLCCHLFLSHFELTPTVLPAP